MTNSRGRRQLRRMLKEAGLSETLRVTSSPREGIGNFYLERNVCCILLVSGFLGVSNNFSGELPVALYNKGRADAKRRPLFSDVYSGQWGLHTNQRPHFVNCTFFYKTMIGPEAGTLKIPFSPQLSRRVEMGHGESFTTPCFGATITGGKPLPGSALDISVSYAFWHLNFRWVRRSQDFHFEAVSGDNSSLYWQQM